MARSGEGSERHLSRKMKNISIAMLGSGFVADFYMQGLGNVNGQTVVLNYSRSPQRARKFAEAVGRRGVHHQLEKAIARDDIDLFIIALPNEIAPAGVAGAVEGAAESGLHQAAGAQSRGGAADAGGGEEVGRDCTATRRPKSSRRRW